MAFPLLGIAAPWIAPVAVKYGLRYALRGARALKGAGKGAPRRTGGYANRAGRTSPRRPRPTNWRRRAAVSGGLVAGGAGLGAFASRGASGAKGLAGGILGAPGAIVGALFGGWGRLVFLGSMVGGGYLLLKKFRFI